MKTTTIWRRLAVMAVALVLTSLAHPLFAQGVVAPSLQTALSRLAPGGALTVVVTYDQEGPLTAEQLGALRSLGITRGLTFEALPIAGVLATAAQVQALAGLPGVASLYPNEPLTFYNKNSRDLTGVDRLRTDGRLRNAQGLPFSGKGVTVVVNDSGIDATHADLPFRTHVVENVQALTNLNAVLDLLPITYLEGQPNTDTNSGHGTHVAGTVAGTGARSGGKYEGVAPGADLVGYGSGGGLFILDALGGFDYAITHQFSFRNPIRVITNSWGSSGPFDPNHPVVQASYRAVQRGIVVLFAAGNEGSGEDTHNPYALAPWVISVGAGDRYARLADFSSRGVRGQASTFTTYDGQTWTARNELTVTAPGVDVISTRAATNVTANGLTADTEIEPAFLPFYTMISGTSMATPHVAGIVALMLEANPRLDPLAVKEMLQATASNMPGRESWEVGAGYVNAYAAVVAALGLRADFGATLNARRAFNSNAVLVKGTAQPFSLSFSPVGTTETLTFEVAADVAQVVARAVVPENTVAIVLTDPEGNRYGSSITLPVLGDVASVSAPGRPGTWQLTVRGIGAVSGVAVDPLRLTNGLALPGTITGTIRFDKTGGFTGLSDIAGHPAEGAIQAAVAARLADGLAGGLFRPDEALTRAHLAQYLVMGAGLRQSLPLEGGFTFADVSAEEAPFAEAAAATGAALKDRAQRQAGVIRVVGAQFRPGQAVLRQELAYALVQSLGLQEAAAGYTGTVYARYDNQSIALDDQAQIAPELRGYVQLALDLGLLNAYFRLEQGPFELKPRLVASFRPAETVTRGAYAVAATRLFGLYDDVIEFEAAGEEALLPGGLLSRAGEEEGGAPEAFTLSQNYPNPFNPTTTISYTLPQTAQVRVVVYNTLGQQVRVLAQGEQAAGTYQVVWDGRDATGTAVASGTYLYRLEAGSLSQVRRMTLVK